MITYFEIKKDEDLNIYICTYSHKQWEEAAIVCAKSWQEAIEKVLSTFPGTEEYYWGCKILTFKGKDMVLDIDYI